LRKQVGASDVVQETFASATRGFGVFRGEHGGAFFRWLHQILTHRVADIARRGGRSRTAVEGSSPESEAKLLRTVSADSSPSAVACDQEYAELIRAGLSRLSERDQLVLRLRFEEQLTFPQIAERCRLSADAARMLFVRAVKRLQRELPIEVEL
jgi:RNA polymerase sigma-70 factor (ECF subfamily)